MSYRKRLGDVAEAKELAHWQSKGWAAFPLSPSYPGVDIIVIGVDEVLLVEVKGRRQRPSEAREAWRRLHAALRPVLATGAHATAILVEYYEGSRVSSYGPPRPLPEPSLPAPQPVGGEEVK